MMATHPHRNAAIGLAVRAYWDRVRAGEIAAPVRMGRPRKALPAATAPAPRIDAGPRVQASEIAAPRGPGRPRIHPVAPAKPATAFAEKLALARAEMAQAGIHSAQALAEDEAYRLAASWVERHRAAIRFHAARGMSRAALCRVYGSDVVAAVLG